MEGGYKEQLAQAFERLFPQEARERSLIDQEELQRQAKDRERAVVGRSLESLAEDYHANLEGIVREPICLVENYDDEGECSNEQYDDTYSLPVRHHFSQKRLPSGYGYKGGAARALFLRTLEIDPNYVPRDIDVIRLAWLNDSCELDDQAAQENMPDDFAYGAGIEVVNDRDEYLTSRDLRLNEILATDDRITFTRGALLDTIRHIIRPTSFEQGGYGEIGPKMLAKILRFNSEFIHRYDQAGIEEVQDWQFEDGFISPFWLALQLDRAYEVSGNVAQRYVDELVARGQVPKDVNTVEDAAVYLLDLVFNFSYRHAPTEQFEMEDHWAQEMEDDKKNRRGKVQRIDRERDNDNEGDDSDGRDQQRKAQHRVKQKAQETAINEAEI